MNLDNFLTISIYFLPVIGLGLDIVGAFIIALPDIPQLNKRFTAGALREGKYQLESIALIQGTRGYDAVIEELESLYDEHFGQDYSLEPRPHHIRVEYGDTVTGPGQKLVAYSAADDEEDQERWEIGNLPYSGLEIYLRRRIQNEESKIRAVGFGLLATGFAVQIIGYLTV